MWCFDLQELASVSCVLKRGFTTRKAFDFGFRHLDGLIISEAILLSSRIKEAFILISASLFEWNKRDQLFSPGKTTAALPRHVIDSAIEY